MAAPAYTPKSGYGTRVTVGNTVYEYRKPGEWVGVMSTTTSKAPPAKAVAKSASQPASKPATPSGDISESALISAMMKKGHTESTARAAIAGRGVADLAREYLGYQAPQSAEEIIANSYQKLLDDYKTRSAEFDAKNPFVFDEILAQKRGEVSQRLDPYYNQTLDDFLRGINVRRTRSAEDERLLLAEISSDVDNYVGKNRELVESAVEASNQGFSDANLFFSGARLRGEGKVRVAGEERLEDYLRETERRGALIRKTGLRTREDLLEEERLRRRDIERERKAETEAEALRETNVAQLRRELERSQYLGPPFSSGTLPNLSSYFSNYL